MAARDRSRAGAAARLLKALGFASLPANIRVDGPVQRPGRKRAGRDAAFRPIWPLPPPRSLFC